MAGYFLVTVPFYRQVQALLETCCQMKIAINAPTTARMIPKMLRPVVVIARERVVIRVASVPPMKEPMIHKINALPNRPVMAGINAFAIPHNNSDNNPDQ